MISNSRKARGLGKILQEAFDPEDDQNREGPDISSSKRR